MYVSVQTRQIQSRQMHFIHSNGSILKRDSHTPVFDSFEEVQRTAEGLGRSIKAWWYTRANEVKRHLPLEVFSATKWSGRTFGKIEPIPFQSPLTCSLISSADETIFPSFDRSLHFSGGNAGGERKMRSRIKPMTSHKLDEPVSGTQHQNILWKEQSS